MSRCNDDCKVEDEAEPGVCEIAIMQLKQCISDWNPRRLLYPLSGGKASTRCRSAGVLVQNNDL